TAAVGARIGDHDPVSVAAAARLGDREEALLEADLTRAAALRACLRLRAGLRAAAVARGARGETRDRERLLAAARRLLEGHLELVLQVLAPPHPRPPTTAAPGAEEVPEEVSEDVLEAGAEVEAAESALLEGCVAEAVVACSPVGIGQNLIGLADLLEALLGLRIARVLVRVILERQLAVGLLQILVAAGPGNAQHLVVVALHRSITTHPHERKPSSAPRRMRAVVQIGPAPTRDPSLFLHFLELRLHDVVLGLVALRLRAAGRAVAAGLRCLGVHRLCQLVRDPPQLLGGLPDRLGVLELERLLRLGERALDAGPGGGIERAAVLGERLLGLVDQPVELVAR